jgi:molybdenum cofactor guanylyltransferase
LGKERVAFDRKRAYIEDESARQAPKGGKVASKFGDPPGVVLAGGLARRMGGGDKPLREIGGATILARVIARLAPQCECLVLSANGDPERFASFGLPVIADGVKDYPGPLAGILAALDWAAANRPNAAWMVSAPGDCPFLPRDLVARLREAAIAEDADLAVAASQGQSHPVIGLWNVALREALRQALVRALPSRDRRLARRADRSVLQRQHGGRPRRGGAACGDRRSSLILDRLKRFSIQTDTPRHRAGWTGE